MWIFNRYDGGLVLPDVCHPDYAACRRKYVCNRYNVSSETQEVTTFHLDLGGSIRATEPYSVVEVNEGCVSYWDWQKDLVVGKLRRAKDRAFDFDGTMYCRTGSWPGTLIFLPESIVDSIMEKILNKPS